MSKIKELFGVEVEEKFDIESKFYGTTKNCYFGIFGRLKAPDTNDLRKSFLMGELITGGAIIIKHKKPILTEEEREYLRAVCNPKFHIGIIETITKIPDNILDTYFLKVNAELGGICLFEFGENLFKGMEVNKPYTPKDLGL